MTPNNEPNWYGASSLPLREKLAAGTTTCEAMVDRHFGNEVELARRLLDSNYALACHYSWCMLAPHIARPSKHMSVSFAAFHKGLFTLASCIDLTRQGLYGPARPLLRHAYEFLMIAKFCCISPDGRVHGRWQDGEVIYFTNGILKKISSPDISPLENLWNELNELTHATRTSSQIGLHFPSIAHELQVNFALVRVLSDWLAHLLTAHIITGSMRYATKRYTPAATSLKIATDNLRSTLNLSRAQHSQDALRLITTFRKKWVVST